MLIAWMQLSLECRDRKTALRLAELAHMTEPTAETMEAVASTRAAYRESLLGLIDVMQQELAAAGGEEAGKVAGPPATRLGSGA